MVLAFTGGIAPRSPDLMRIEWEHARGRLEPAALDEARRREETAWVQAQRDAGLDPAAPALATWQDLLRPLTQHCRGAEEGPLTRTFETNTFHRQIRFTQPPRLDRDAAAWLPDPVPDGPWVLTLPAPADVLRRSTVDDGVDRQAVLDSVADTLNAVARAALSADAALVRLHDPGLLYPRTPPSQRTLDGLARAAKGIEARCILHLTQGDPFEHWDILESVPVGALSIEDPGRAPPAGARLPDGVRLIVATLSGDQSLQDDPQVQARQAARMADALSAPLLGLTNGWDLEHLPHAVALRKLPTLARAAALTQEKEVTA